MLQSENLCSYLTLSYGKACYRPALRPPMDSMRISELTFRLLEPLGVFIKLQEFSISYSNAPVLIHLELINVYRTVFFVSQREHYIFREGVEWCHILLYLCS